ncbi:MAG: hypothetical protein KIT72_14035 [Polyangiaceae bacterium]|nr:hypothetical protein [Polyangiaceae bacterium]MCW5791532.1 hypothetical protein [Polyangiaceae bacterium]
MDEAALSELESTHAAGLTSSEILALFAERGAAISEATLRKYVQLGLLPRSVRVGRKGKHQGSQGVYPASVVRQIQVIKDMMAESYTIEQIQREFLFMRGDLDQLTRTLGSLFQTLDRVMDERRTDPVAALAERDVLEARGLGARLVERLTQVEQRLTSRAKIQGVLSS